MKLKNKAKATRTYTISILLAIGIGLLSSLSTDGKMEEYSQLQLPFLSPPSWAFPLVWFILFVLMGISAALVAQSGAPQKSDALFIYGTQLVVNFLWTIFFVNFDAKLLAFFWLIFLLLLAILMISRFWRISPKAGKLQLPYLLWLIVAGYLNIMIYFLNR